MANRYPLIVDSSTELIKELPAGDGLLFADNDKIIMGTGTDLNLYHDGSNSYITNATGALKLATETSGIAVTIGHTTSETTVGDNLTVTGDFSVGGNFDVTGTLDFSDSAISNVGDISLDSISGDSDSDTSITFSGSNVITVKAANEDQVTFIDGAIVPSADNNIDLGTSSVEFKDAFFDGTVTSDAFAGPLTGAVTGNADTATALASARTIHGVSFDGTANIDLSEEIADTIGAMVSSNTETNIAVTYEDGDNTLDFVIGTLNQDTSGTAALATSVTASANNATDETVYPVFVDGATGTQGIETDTGLTYNPSSGILTSTQFTGAVVGNVTGNASGTAATVTGGTQASITSAANLVTVGTIGTGVWQGTAIASGYIAADAITGAKIADDAIDSEHYTNASIDLAHMSVNSIDSDQYVDGSIDTDHIADDQVTAAKLANTAVTAAAYGSSSAIPVITIDAQGRITAASTAATSSVLTIGADSGSDDTVTVGTDTLDFVGTSNEIETTVSNNQIQIGLPNNVTIAGNLTVSGDTVTVNTATLSVEDPLIILASGNNAADAVDIGIYGLYDTSGSQDLYSGIFRDASDSGKWKLFKDNQAAPTTTVNTSGTGYATGTLVANLEGNVTGNVTGNTSGTAATVTTAAQTNITSLGTLTALTVDDVAVDGKVVTMTGSASDTATLTVGTNGTLAITTTDAAAAAANMTLTADGTFEAVGTTITLDSGGAINLEPAAGSAILLDGTISVDAGVVTGATSITSTAFVGDITGDVTGDVSGSAGSATGNAATATALANARTIGGTSFDGTGNIAVATATEATNVTVSANQSTNESVYLAFVDGATGTQGIETDTALYYNPATNTLISPTLSATTLTGTLSTAAQANITSTGTLSSLTVSGDITTAAKIIHSGDTDTYIHFQDNNVATWSGGQNTINQISGVNYMNSVSPTAPSGSSERSYIYHNNAGSTSLHIGDQYAGSIRFEVGSGSEKFRIASSGQLGIGGANYGSDGQVLTSTGASTAPAWETVSGGGGGGPTSLEEDDSIYVGNDPSGTTNSALRNAALGKYALDSVTDGDDNVAVGAHALTANTSGTHNTAVGTYALAASTSGTHGTAVGYGANRYGTGETAMGHSALSNAGHTGNGDNVALGHNTLPGLTSGTQCVAVGSGAGNGTVTATQNVFMGKSAGWVTTGSQNTGVARRACQGVTSGSGNTAFGFQTMYSGPGAGNNNTMIGAYCGQVFSGSNNFGIGYQANYSGSPGGQQSGNNEGFLGDENIVTINAQVGITAASDKRDKSDVEPLTMGLSFINQLEPVTYRWDKRTKYIKKYQLDLPKDDPDFVDLDEVVHDGTHTEPQLCAGLLAQDVEEIEQSYGFDKADQTALVTNLSGDGKQYSLQYERFVPMLIKSVQELSEQVETLKDEIEELKG